MIPSILTYAPLLGVALLLLLVPLFLRRVVEPNEVHIVQSKRGTRTYGKDQAGGNAYYDWPSWLPVIGVQTVSLPLSVFSIKLEDYSAYDRDKVPFVVDITAFFRIMDSARAAERVLDEEELAEQLRSILQGAARTILAQSDIETIMVERATYGERFTKEVDEQLKEWGVCTVKNIELMDIRDAEGSRVIENIMAKKTSEIERESRMKVAENRQLAVTKEIEAKREVDLADQEAKQRVGLRTAEQEQLVGVRRQQAEQEVKAAERETAERAMEVERVNQVRAAEIAKDVQVQNAEAQLEAERRRATAVQVNGEAAASASKLMQLAPVEAQITLAKEIGENAGYQDYLIRVRDVERLQAVGVAQAEALAKADVRVISQGGTPVEGVDNVMQLFSAKGGQSLGAMAEAFVQTPVGEALLSKLGYKRDGTAA